MGSGTVGVGDVAWLAVVGQRSHGEAGQVDQRQVGHVRRVVAHEDWRGRDALLRAGARLRLRLDRGADLLQLQFVCTKLDNRDGLFGASDPFVKLSRGNPLHPGSWKAVWQSEVIMNNHHPTFRPATVSVQALCNGDYDRQGLLQVFDWDSDGTHDLIWSRSKPEAA